MGSAVVLESPSVSPFPPFGGKGEGPSAGPWRLNRPRAIYKVLLLASSARKGETEGDQDKGTAMVLESPSISPFPRFGGKGEGPSAKPWRLNPPRSHLQGPPPCELRSEGGDRGGSSSRSGMNSLRRRIGRALFCSKLAARCSQNLTPNCMAAPKESPASPLRARSKWLRRLDRPIPREMLPSSSTRS